MNYGGKHKVGMPNPNPPEDGVFHLKSFDPGNPDMQEDWPVDMQAKAAIDPLAGKSGKDSLTEEEVVYT
jgi:hypothetical protein